jgi:hypothetical protein
MHEMAVSDGAAHAVAICEIDVAAANDDCASDECRGVAHSNVWAGEAGGERKR